MVRYVSEALEEEGGGVDQALSRLSSEPWPVVCQPLGAGVERRQQSGDRFGQLWIGLIDDRRRPSKFSR